MPTPSRTMRNTRTSGDPRGEVSLPQVVGDGGGPVGAFADQRRDADRMARAHVEARDALADRAQDFVGQRLAARGDLLDGGRRALLLAETARLVPTGAPGHPGD